MIKTEFFIVVEKKFEEVKKKWNQNNPSIPFTREDFASDYSDFICGAWLKVGIPTEYFDEAGDLSDDDVEKLMQNKDRHELDAFPYIKPKFNPIPRGSGKTATLAYVEWCKIQGIEPEFVVTKIKVDEKSR